MRKTEKSVMNSAEIEFHRWTPSGYSWQIPAAQFTDYWIHCSLLIFNHYLYEHPQHSSDSGGVEKDFLSLTRRCRSVNVRFFCSKKCKGLRVWESKHRRLSHHTFATCGCCRGCTIRTRMEGKNERIFPSSEHHQGISHEPWAII